MYFHYYTQKHYNDETITLCNTENYVAISTKKGMHYEKKNYIIWKQYQKKKKKSYLTTVWKSMNRIHYKLLYARKFFSVKEICIRTEQT